MGGVHLVLGHAPLMDLALLANSKVVGRAGGFQLELPFALPVVKPVQELLVFFGGHHLFRGDVHPAAHRHQQEGVQGVGAQRQGHLQHLRQLVDVVLGDGGVDLGGDPGGLDVFQAALRRLEGPGDAAEAVVGLGVGAVEADGHPADAGGPDLPGHLGGDHGAVGGQGHQQPALPGIGGNLEQVFAVQRFATAQDEYWVGVTGDLLDDLQGVGRRQVKRRGKLLSGGATVDAAQVASGCQLPEHQARDGFGRVHGRTSIAAGVGPGVTSDSTEALRGTIDGSGEPNRLRRRALVFGWGMGLTAPLQRGCPVQGTQTAKGGCQGKGFFL